MSSKGLTIFKSRPVVICGPSGSGKSTLLHKILAEYPDEFSLTVSHTTRKPRVGEINGKHYYFTTIEDMKKAINDGKFIETAQFGGNIYGTSKDAVDNIIKKRKICILDVEINGVKQIKKTDLNPWYVFVKPPSIETLEKRLRERNTETEESLKKRLQVANAEIEFGIQPGNFDKIIVNDVLEIAHKELNDFIKYNVLKY